nr:hypothetical protein [Saprospiraceae bacterium]
MDTVKKLMPLTIRFFAYALLMFFISVVISMDFALSEFDEDSYTEMTQETLLFIAVVMLALAAFWFKFMREFTIILALFFLVHLIRELDGYFDVLVYHGFWKVPVWIVVAIAFYILFKNGKKYLRQLLYIQDKYPFGILLVGLLTLHVFSRLYGRSSNWKNLFQDEYLRVIKDASEESIELLGYSIILIAVVELILHIRGKSAEGITDPQHLLTADRSKD